MSAEHFLENVKNILILSNKKAVLLISETAFLFILLEYLENRSQKDAQIHHLS
jgi:hypothetical protein